MYNYVMLMGKLEGMRAESKDYHEIDLAVQRTFVEPDGRRVTDHFTIQVPNYIAEIIKDSDILVKNKTVSVKGRLIPVMVGTSAMIIAERVMWGE